jgi:hypothetical protein
MRHFEPGGTIDIPLVASQFAADGRKQAGFAGTVGAGEADLVAAENDEVNLLEQRFRTAAQSEIAGRQHRAEVL